MINGKTIVVVLPAYNAAKTLEMTYSEIPFDIVDDVVLVDDHSRDDTSAVGRELGIKHVIRHDRNRGYGGNQKTCYRAALDLGADIVIMLHPDYQYTPKLIPSMAYLIANDVYHVVLGSRILGKGARRGGMPLYKYIANRGLTFIQNLLRTVLETIDIEKNSDDFVFDNQMLSQIIMKDFEIAEVTCPTKYFDDASSINFRRSTIYGFGVLWTSLQHRLHTMGVKNERY